MADGPSKKDIEAIFTRLRSIPANKVCFDCNAKNPTWSSVTYGVFICIDCSAVHRGLGVHLTFVRSTQLDTNWTWLQLRQMQVGGNANATQFFSQHNCVTLDAQQKYNSRAAQLYREKLQNLAQQAMNSNGKELHLHPATDTSVHEPEVDFFTEHESLSFQGYEQQSNESFQLRKDNNDGAFEISGEPSINLTPADLSQIRKPTIGVRKVQPKKSGLGAKKGLGATKVKTDFAEIEREVTLADENRKKATEDVQQPVTLSTEEQEKQMTSMRLAYQDLSLKQKKEEAKLRQTDPKKAEQIERLGMGFASRSGISHSAVTDMQVIEQENLEKTQTPLSKLMSRESDGFFDDYNFSSSSFSMNRNSFGPSGNSNKYAGSGSGDLDSMFMYSDANIDWPEPTTPKQKAYQPVIEKEKPTPNLPASDGDTAQKKFGNAKAISSDQFFNNGSDDWERKANLSRFQGSSSISSADYFGDNQNPKQNMTNNFQAPDFDDVKESVRQGVTKVAGKLSSLANGVMSSIQDRYGY